MNEADVGIWQRKLGMTYQVESAATCDQLVGIAGKDVLEIGGALPETLVFDGLHARSWVAMDPTLTPQAREGDAGPDCLDRPRYPEEGSYTRLNIRVEDAQESFKNSFDLLLSIACFEHILDLPRALLAMREMLRPGGTLFSLFSPIWSGHDGHHLGQITDQSGRRFSRSENPIPPWGHLLMRPFEMHEYLCRHTDMETASALVYQIYFSETLNRIFAEEYIDLFKKIPFGTGEASLLYKRDVSQDTWRRLKEKYPQYDSFAYDGIMAVMTK